MRRRKRITVFHFLSNFKKASSSFHRGGWGLWQADEMTHLYIWDDSNKDHQSHYACLLDLSLFVFTENKINHLSSTLWFFLLFYLCYHIESTRQAAVVISLFRAFVVETVRDLWQSEHTCQTKISLKSCCSRWKKKNVEATLKVLKFWVGLFSFDLLLTFAFTLMTAHDEMQSQPLKLLSLFSEWATGKLHVCAEQFLMRTHY